MTRRQGVFGTIAVLAVAAAFVLLFERPAYDAGYRLGHAIHGAR